MRSSRTGLALVLMASFGLLACGSGSAQTKMANPGAASVENDATADLTEHYFYHHRGGAMLFVALGLDTLGISPEQREAVEKIQRDLETGMEPAKTAEQNLESTLADGVAAGNIDTQKVDALVAAVAGAGATGEPSTALNNLHAVLTPIQRATLVEKVEANWAVWQSANVPGTLPGAAESTRLARLREDLALTAGQENLIRTRLSEGAESRAGLDANEMGSELRAFGSAFKSDTFDAHDAPLAGPANVHTVQWAAAQLARFVEATSPILTTEQRSQYARTLRDHARHNPLARGTQ